MNDRASQDEEYQKSLMLEEKINDLEQAFMDKKETEETKNYE